jgi:hypothetical protein
MPGMSMTEAKSPEAKTIGEAMTKTSGFHG